MKLHFFSVFSFTTLANVPIIIGVSLRIIKVRLPVATSLASLLLLFLPLVGAIAYLVLGRL
jgi:hypothetical protein